LTKYKYCVKITLIYSPHLFFMEEPALEKYEPVARREMGQKASLLPMKSMKEQGESQKQLAQDMESLLIQRVTKQKILNVCENNIFTSRNLIVDRENGENGAFCLTIASVHPTDKRFIAVRFDPNDKANNSKPWSLTIEMGNLSQTIHCAKQDLDVLFDSVCYYGEKLELLQTNA